MYYICSDHVLSFGSWDLVTLYMLTSMAMYAYEILRPKLVSKAKYCWHIASAHLLQVSHLFGNTQTHSSV